jgi:cytochrome c oxidase subunit 2
MKTRVLVQAPQEFDAWLQSQKVAAKEDLTQAIATNPTDLPPDQFLAPYTQDLGITNETLTQLPHAHPHSHEHVAMVSGAAS